MSHHERLPPSARRTKIKNNSCLVTSTTAVCIMNYAIIIVPLPEKRFAVEKTRAPRASLQILVYLQRLSIIKLYKTSVTVCTIRVQYYLPHYVAGVVFTSNIYRIVALFVFVSAPPLPCVDKGNDREMMTMTMTMTTTTTTMTWSHPRPRRR